MPETVASIADTLGRALDGAQGHAAPFPYFRAASLFPDGIFSYLAELSFAGEGQQVYDGRREANAERAYIDAARCAGDPRLAALTEAFQSEAVWGALSALCGAAFEGSYLRLEYVQDREGFWLAPHTDLGVKKLTFLIALEGTADLGTDLYEAPEEPSRAPEAVERLPFEPNAGIFFVPGPKSWHGFAPRHIKGERKSLIVNYVGPEWASREQLAFPDRPIGL